MDDRPMDDQPNDLPLEALPDLPLEEPLRTAARSYHTPPPTPSEAMWRAIEAERRVDRGEAPAYPLELRTAVRRRWVTWAMAAAAVLALGVGIGRVSAPDGTIGRPATPVATTSAARRRVHRWIAMGRTG